MGGYSSVGNLPSTTQSTTTVPPKPGDIYIPPDLDDPITDTFEEEIWSPLPVNKLDAKELHEDYSVERAHGGLMMADFLTKLVPYSLDTIQHLVELKTLFTKGNLSPNNPYSWIERNPRLKDLIDWCDLKFAGVRAWPPEKGIGNPQAKQIKLQVLYSLARGVKYLSTEQQRDKYKITIKAGVLFRNGIEFDTSKLYAGLKDKRTYNMTNDPGQGVIWVLGKDAVLYSAVAKLGRIHHSSFFGGNAILSGGDWEVEKGKIKQISGRTGHYRAPMESFISVLDMLYNHSAIEYVQKVAKVFKIPKGTPTDISLGMLKMFHHNYQLFSL